MRQNRRRFDPDFNDRPGEIGEIKREISLFRTQFLLGLADVRKLLEEIRDGKKDKPKLPFIGGCRIVTEKKK